MVLAQAADDRKAGNVDIYKVAEVTYLTDFLVIVTGYSRTQVRAIAEAMQLQAEQQCDRQPLQKEGESERSWIVLDYGDVMAHIMMPEQRDYYNLEAFWGHGEHILFTSAE
jgi:ribosome-associated protein